MQFRSEPLLRPRDRCRWDGFGSRLGLRLPRFRLSWLPSASPVGLACGRRSLCGVRFLRLARSGPCPSSAGAGRVASLPFVRLFAGPPTAAAGPGPRVLVLVRLRTTSVYSPSRSVRQWHSFQWRRRSCRRRADNPAFCCRAKALVTLRNRTGLSARLLSASLPIFSLHGRSAREVPAGVWGGCLSAGTTRAGISAVPLGRASLPACGLRPHTPVVLRPASRPATLPSLLEKPHRSPRIRLRHEASGGVCGASHENRLLCRLFCLGHRRSRKEGQVVLPSLHRPDRRPVPSSGCSRLPSELTSRHPGSQSSPARDNRP